MKLNKCLISSAADLKSNNLSTVDSLNHHDRSKSLHSSAAAAAALSLNSSRLHAFGGGISLPSSVPAPNLSQSISSASPTTTTALSSQTIIPPKYEFAPNPILHGDTNHCIGNGNTSVNHNNNNNIGAGNSYAAMQSHLSYADVVKSETNAANYDYMNSCLQSGYFNSSFGSLGGTASAATTHSVADLAGYHHQHNVIQAAKLMATS